jgi:hypothetical protein
VTKLRFIDAMEIDTDGELRVVQEQWLLRCPVDSREEGEHMIAEPNARKRKARREAGLSCGAVEVGSQVGS